MIVVLLALSAVLSATETSVIAASKVRLHALVKEGDPRAKIIVRLRKNMGQLLSSLLIGNTAINLTASNLATGILVGLYGDVGVFYATIIMTALIVFYCEVMPKIYAINFPEAASLHVARLINIICIAIGPVTRVAEYLARKTFVLFGVKTSSFSELVSTTEELRGLIEMHVGPGEEVIHERAMLRSILDLTTVDVSDIMIHRKNVFMLDINLGPEKIIQQILECPFTRVPLWRDNPDNIVGVLHAKVMFRALREAKNDFSKINIYEIAAKPWFIPETTTLLDQLHAFRRRREHFSVVVDEYGVLMGVVTLEDILEEIVGEIEDEHDIEIPGVRVGQDGSIVILGSVTIRDLNRQFEWELPDEEASTIAGLVLHETRQIPEVGQTFIIRGFKVEILRRQRNQITLLKIIPPEQRES